MREIVICSDCLNAHEVFRDAAFAGHKVTSVKQFQAEDYEALLKRKAFCTEKYHEREVTRFYCRVCQTCICQICINTDHKNHEIEPLEKAADDERAKILTEVELMNQKNKVCNNITTELEKAIAKVETDIATAKRTVSQTTKEIIATVHKRKSEAMTALENMGVCRINELDSVKKQVELLAKQIKQAIAFATELSLRSTCSDIMRSRENLEKRFEELGKTEIPAVPASSLLKFVSTCKLEMLSLGFISTSETNAGRSAVKRTRELFQAGVEAEIVICPKTLEGQTSNRQHEDHIDVQVEPADQLACLVINEKAGGNFQVKFVPKLPGAYHISAKINGDNLAQSPFNIEVQERKLEIVGKLDFQNESLKIPAGIAVSSKGLIAVADYNKHCILIFNSEGTFKRQVGCYGDNLGTLNSPVDVTFINDDEILVADECNHRIQQFNVHSGKFVNSFGRRGRGDGEFRNAVSVCVDGDGHVIVADYHNNRVQVLTMDGEPVLKFGDSGPEKLNGPVSCVFYDNMFIVADSKNGCLKLFDSCGKFLRKIGEKGNADGQFLRPWGLCADKHGNIVVCDRDSGHVQQFTIEGRLTGKTVSKLKRPSGVTIMPDDRILISDFIAVKVLFLK